MAVYREHRFAEALEAARTICAAFPSEPAGWSVRGASARKLGHTREAEESFDQLEMLTPEFAGAPYNRALIHADKGEVEAAMAAYQRALKIDPDLALAHNNLGILLAGQWRIEEALAHLERACALQPGMAEVHNSLGNALSRARRVEGARAAYLRALAVQPGFVNAHYNLGVLELGLGNWQAAITAYRGALALMPDYTLARAGLLQASAQICDWDVLSENEGLVAELGVNTDGVPPWPMLALDDSPPRQLTRARNWAARRLAPLTQSSPGHLPAQPRQRKDRLRLAYVSADFHDHPGARLLGGMLKRHDRSRFEIHAFSIGAKRDDMWRRAAEESIEHFHDVAQWPDARIVEFARALDLDIAIDRQGYTVDARTQLFQYRIAPVQIQYLGYPGTMGSPFIDYQIGDRVTVPDENRPYHSEHIIRLPNSYMATDNALPISDTPTTRADHGLPDDAFVLCCFNNNYKLMPREFSIWMRVMAQVEGSVLWLYRSNAAAEANLKRQAERCGIAPERIVFAVRLPNPQHLERHRHADLFVDTFNMNAHTTTVDALWAGLPVVTKQGGQFAARVASSLLHAAGMPELVTTSEADYERLILELATDPARLSGTRAQLAANRLTTALFDTVGYTRYFETALEMAHARHLAGLPPAHFDVPA